MAMVETSPGAPSERLARLKFEPAVYTIHRSMPFVVISAAGMNNETA